MLCEYSKKCLNDPTSTSDKAFIAIPRQRLAALLGILLGYMLQGAVPVLLRSPRRLCALHYYTLLCALLLHYYYALLHHSLLRIITILLLHCYYIIITYYNIIHYCSVLRFLLSHCYYIIITYYYMMKMSDVEATGSGGSRAEDSEARPQVAGYGARPGN